MRYGRRSAGLLAAVTTLLPLSAVGRELPPAGDQAVDFVRDIQPIFAAHCVECHGPDKRKGGYRLDINHIAFEGGDSHAPNLLRGDSANSPLIKFVAGLEPDMEMPPDGPPLGAKEIATLRAWIDQGADWPDSANAPADAVPDLWSLKPLVRPDVPASPASPHPVDAFIHAKLRDRGLVPSPEADRRTLIRRAFFDLHGLPPTPADVAAFIEDPDPRAWETLIDRLLESPRYGERWARHWLDVVHYGDTHGYDKDQPRPHAWPYRDYVIRAFNEDRPYGRFIREQIAGDVLHPDTRDGIEALGFLAAGPWDFIGHAEVSEEKIDGKIARHLDRDDMVATTIGTFASLTVHCAQCHDHKFDPISQEDYFSLQAVFAAIDRTNLAYDLDPATGWRRNQLAREQSAVDAELAAFIQDAETAAGAGLAEVDRHLAEVRESAERAQGISANFGWHGAVSPEQDTEQWVQVDLGGVQALGRIVLDPCSDDFNGIGDGFGFPLRFRIESSDDPGFQSGVVIHLDATNDDFPNPGLSPVACEADGISGRHVRVTAVKLAPRQNDFNFALSELNVFDPAGRLISKGADVSSDGSVEAPPRWSRANLTDGYSQGAGTGDSSVALAELEATRTRIIDAALGPEGVAARERLQHRALELKSEIDTLPPLAQVYAGGIHHGTGAFQGTGGTGGRPRPIHLLARGDVTRPVREVQPGAIAAVAHQPGRFDLPPDAPEGTRRAALANWLADPANPLTWRSAVNRVWHYHFGRAIADSPNDFGRMGEAPSHPELLDWLASDFRDNGGSFKRLHRQILTSATYRQRSDTPAGAAAEIDAENRLLWRVNRRKLEAEAVRDSTLMVAGKLDLSMGGPGFQDFVIENPEHSPHYQYHLADAANPALHRRSIYRFIARSKPQPWMTALDCADPSMAVEKRNQSVSPLQALAQMNNQLVLVMAAEFATRLEATQPAAERVELAYQLALQRPPTPEEARVLTDFADRHGWPAACRILLNLNEFTFTD